MEVIFILAIVSGIVALIVKAVSGHNRLVAKAWQDAATQLGMRFTPGSVMHTKSIQGRLYENRVEVDTFKRSSGKSSKTYTRYRIYFPEPLGLGLHLKQQGFMTGVATFFGSQDIEIGDPQFDPEVVVKGNYPERVVEFLTPSRRLRILRLFQNFPGCEIKDQVIEWSKQGNEKQVEPIVGTVRRLSFAATRLRESAESGREEPAAEVGERRVSAPEPVLEPEPEPVVPKVEAEPIAPAVIAPAVVDAASDGLDVTTVCNDLFASSVMSFEARRLFDERYKDRSVRWSGELQSVTSYQIDRVFKGAAGSKMALDLTEVEGAFGRTAQAIVQLPQDAAEGLRARVGESITFEGRLLNCDVLMRTFFIVDSKLP